MAEQQVHHVKLHTSNSGWIFYLIFLAMMGAFLYFLLNRLNAEDDNAEIAPYSLDLRGENASVDVRTLDGLDVVVTVTKQDSQEIRFYDGYTGKLFGTVYAPVGGEDEPETE